MVMLGSPMQQVQMGLHSWTGVVVLCSPGGPRARISGSVGQSMQLRRSRPFQDGSKCSCMRCLQGPETAASGCWSIMSSMSAPEGSAHLLK